MSEQQPEALQLADELENDHQWLAQEEAIHIASMLGARDELRRQHAEIERLMVERDALRGVPTELIACLIDARDDVAAELQRCREAAGYPSTDRRLAAQETLLERVDAAISAAEDHPPAQPVKRLTEEQIVAIAIGAGVDPEDEDDDGSTVFAIARAVERAHGINLPAGEDKPC